MLLRQPGLLSDHGIGPSSRPGFPGGSVPRPGPAAAARPLATAATAQAAAARTAALVTPGSESRRDARARGPPGPRESPPRGTVTVQVALTCPGSQRLGASETRRARRRPPAAGRSGSDTPDGSRLARGSDRDRTLSSQACPPSQV
eukprot:747025-Hanusia_phi.AAC.1